MDIRLSRPNVIPFPADITDMQDWGSTVLQVGKFGKRGSSYADLAGSADPEIQKYLTWLLKAIRENFDPQYHDLVAYLKKAEFGVKKGNSFTRVRKNDWRAARLARMAYSILEQMHERHGSSASVFT